MKKPILTIFSIVILVALLAACAPATPQTVIQTVVVPGEEVVKTVEVV